MTHIATLIADPARFALDEAPLARALTALPAPGAVQWLERGIAADIPFTPRPGADQREIADMVRAALGEIPVDIVVQPAAHRRKKLLVADMDSTMIAQECIDELADLVGLKAHVSAITERAMRGEIAFEPALRERVSLLKGLPVAVVDRLLSTRITLTPGGRTLIATMRAHGAYTCLVSGGFTLFTQPIARMIGFDEQRANILALSNNQTFAGTVGEPILGREAKLATLLDLAARQGIGLDETLAIGDGANDLAMLGAAGLGIAYHAKPAVAAAAHARIDHNDLSALLYVQGYRREEFAL
ncbi:MAG: phosphoserine phosphatase SerB [Pseudorhodoplanes sp.]|nr:phosphoserine phosphatase SerB [Pseudorhodoplanes sp.]